MYKYIFFSFFKNNKTKRKFISKYTIFTETEDLIHARRLVAYDRSKQCYSYGAQFYLNGKGLITSSGIYTMKEHRTKNTEHRQWTTSKSVSLNLVCPMRTFLQHKYVRMFTPFPRLSASKRAFQLTPT